MRRPRAPRRETLQKGIIILPSAFTLGNLFFGIYAIIAATRGDLVWAGWFIVFAGTLDMLDGSVARFTRTGSRFGAELDSLVDVVSFGVAPGFIIYEIFFVDAQWAWLLSFVYITAVVLRLARFNIEHDGEAKRHFHGLPSPAAGGTLATYYPVSQTAFFETYLSDLPWAQIMGVGMVLLGVLDFTHGGDAESVVGKPRYHHQYLPDHVEYEPGALSPERLAGLKKLGHKFEKVNRHYGDMHAVIWNKADGTMDAASDPRGIGCAAIGDQAPVCEHESRDKEVTTSE